MIRHLLLFAVIFSPLARAVDLPTILRQIGEAKVERINAVHETRETSSSDFVLDLSRMLLVELVIQGEATSVFIDRYGTDLEVSLTKSTGRTNEFSGQEAQLVVQAVRNRVASERFAASRIRVDGTKYNLLNLSFIDGATITKISYRRVRLASGGSEIFPQGYDLIDSWGHSLRLEVQLSTTIVAVALDLKDTSGAVLRHELLEGKTAQDTFKILSERGRVIREKFISPATVDAIVQSNAKQERPEEPGVLERLGKRMGLYTAAPPPPALALSNFTLFQSTDLILLRNSNCSLILANEL